MYLNSLVFFFVYILFYVFEFIRIFLLCVHFILCILIDWYCLLLFQDIQEALVFIYFIKCIPGGIHFIYLNLMVSFPMIPGHPGSVPRAVQGAGHLLLRVAPRAHLQGAHTPARGVRQ